MNRRFWEGKWRQVLSDGSIGPPCSPPTDEERAEMARAEETRRDGATSVATVVAPPVSSSVTEPPGEAVSKTLKVIGWLGLGAGVLISFTGGDLTHGFLGFLSLVGALASATVIDLLRIIARRT